MRPWKSFILAGRSRRVQDIDTAHAAVLALYPGARREGSVASWHWKHEGRVVAEALAADRGGHWYLRVLPKTPTC